MPAERTVTVVKLGGSYAFSPHLRDWLDALAACAGDVVLVPGGGPFADAVRDAQPRMGFDDEAAHRMALLAMEQYACALASLSPQVGLAQSCGEIDRLRRDGKLPVWLPGRMALAAADIPCAWEVTSDSLAAWLAGTIGAGQLLLVKHFEPQAGPICARDLATRGMVDRQFPFLLRASGAAGFLAGPADHAAVAVALRAGRPAGRPIALA
jgi:dihydroneopterin aldolase